MKANENNNLSGGVAISGVFDWSNFDEKKFYDVREEADKGELILDDYKGSVRIGDICFDIMITQNQDQEEYMCFDSFVGGVDSGYGYSQKDGYPYDQIEYGNFDPEWMKMDYEKFKKSAEKSFLAFIDEANTYYKEADLYEKANEPLHIW